MDRKKQEQENVFAGISMGTMVYMRVLLAKLEINTHAIPAEELAEVFQAFEDAQVRLQVLAEKYEEVGSR
jgi:alpha/beta superfamily hydrolase